MTTVIVNSGACGFVVTITVEKNKDGKMTLALDTDCAMVKKMLEDIAILDRFAPLAGFLKNPVYTSAAKHLKHVACPVPSGILKALEVEAGLNVMKDASIVFDRNRHR
jgi:hypothetical protein